MDYKEKVIALLNSKELSQEQKEGLEKIFPELAESEDEKIRKALKEYFINSFQNNGVAAILGVHIKDILSWLEKQGEQKPQRMVSAEAKEAMYDKPAWSEENEKMLKDTIRFCELCGNQVSANWLKSLIPQNWTKEDKERYISCLQRLGTGNPEQPETINSKWFKEHVYPQSTWKPSDEQMGALNAINVTGGVSYAGQGQELINLYNDLKKLMEE